MSNGFEGLGRARCARVAKATIVGSCAVLVALVAAPTARAEKNGFAEVVVGMANPIGDDDYDDIVENSFKLGVRGGVFRGAPLSGGVHLGFELGADWALADTKLDDGPNFDATFHRFRFLAGGRVNVNLMKKLSLFFRAGAGLDVVLGSLSLTIGQTTTTTDENDLGFALEFGGGAVVEAGGYLFGMQLALPIAWHDDPSSGAGDVLYYDYTSYELDLLVTAGTRF